MAAIIDIEEILAGKYLSPFTLAEFEHHLVNVQRAEENLYFYFFLSDYTNRYREWEASLVSRRDYLTRVTGDAEKTRYIEKDCVQTNDFFGSRTKEMTDQCENEAKPPSYPAQIDLEAQPPRELRHHFQSFQSSFLPLCHSGRTFLRFDLELNISEELRDQFSLQAKTSIDPAIFQPIKKEVINMLTDSMQNWLLSIPANSDINRAHRTVCVGAISVILVIIGSVLLILQAKPVQFQLCLSPFLWIGIDILFSGFYRACPLIFIFGSYWQSHLWELLKAEEAAAMTMQRLLSRYHNRVKDVDRSRDVADEIILNITANDEKTCVPFNSDPSTLLAAWDSRIRIHSDQELESQTPPRIGMAINDSSLDSFKTARKTSFVTSPSSQKEPTLGEQPSQHTSKPSAPISDRLTNIVVPVTIQTLRMRVLKSATFATGFTILWVAVWISVPNHRASG